MPICPVCSGKTFDSFGNRPNARCIKCGSLERGRLTWIILNIFGKLTPGTRLLNIAPEPFMLFHAAERIGPSYLAGDFNPENFSKWKKPVLKIDLCGDLPFEEKFDVIIHNHVLEHIPCSPEKAIMRLNTHLAPGGIHLFSVPILEGRHTEEDLSVDLSSEDRVRRFGQSDHLRVFGDVDFNQFLHACGLTFGMIDLRDTISRKELFNAGVPPETFDNYNSHRVFLWKNFCGG